MLELAQRCDIFEAESSVSEHCLQCGLLIDPDECNGFCSFECEQDYDKGRKSIVYIPAG